jgi:large subunit ribosomal protein L20
MARVKRSKIAMKHRRNVLKRAKGYQFGRSKKEIEAKVALRKAGSHAFAHRKDFKNDMRRLWTVRLGAVLREEGTNHSTFIKALKTKNIELDRKILADLAVNHPEALKQIITSVK